MAAWGVGIFDDDLAQNVRKDFQRAVDAGQSVYEAARGILERYAAANSAVVYLALAALQLEHGLVQPRIRKTALTVIITGEGVEPWAEAPAETRAARERELDNLRNRLREMG